MSCSVRLTVSSLRALHLRYCWSYGSVLSWVCNTLLIRNGFALCSGADRCLAPATHLSTRLLTHFKRTARANGLRWVPTSRDAS